MIMRKFQRISFLGMIAMAFTLFMVTSCTKEGPEGPAGEDGVNGEDAIVSCLECHESTQIAVIQAEFNTSGHYGGAAAVSYAGGRASCAECHSHEGFVEYTTNGEVAGDISGPSAWNCGTCHGLHTNFDSTDYGFRITEAPTFLYDETTSFDFGDANLCAFCHQTRSGGPEADADGNFEITSTHWGPHHGPQANLMAGVGFAEVAGDATYNNEPYGPHSAFSCTDCHMGDYNADNNQGGHSFNANVDACTSCHSGAAPDFAGLTQEVNDKLVVLEGLLSDQGVLDAEGHVIPATYTLVQAQAYFNYIGILEDRSGGAHNPGYINALLDNTIDALQAK
jgi:hypothetical protein